VTLRPDIDRIVRDCGAGSIVGEIEPFGSGHSGFTYAFDTTDAGWLVLRLSPPGVRIAGPTDIGRQGRIMGALHASGLPVPDIRACSSEPELDGRSYALMTLVEGVDSDAAIAAVGGERIARAAIETLHSLRSLPIADTSIGEEEPSAPEDEIDRWAGLLQRAPERLHERGREFETALRASVVAPDAPALVHGDFHFGNLIFSGEAVSAVVDWEIAEIGQPLVDLASVLVTTLRSRYAPDPNPSGNLGAEARDLIAWYGADEHKATWYTALGCFKYASILGYNFQLHLSGRRPDPLYERLQRTMSGLLDDGIAILQFGLDAVSTSQPASA
jgi:aminoglycoside phosphotransferase (APT) family kinase protein